MKNISIAVRLTAWFSAVFLGGFIVFGVVMWFDLAWHLSEGRDRTLTRRSARLLEVLTSTQDAPVATREAKFLQLADAVPEGNLIHLYDADGVRLFPVNASPADFPWNTAPPGPEDTFGNVTYSGKPFRILTRHVTFNDRHLTIRVAGQLEDNRQLLSRFATGLETATPVLLVVSALCGYLLGRRVLRPVDSLTAAVRSISIGNLSGRLPIHPTGDELQRLAETCNDMLARLEGAVSRINRFTADASHELRNPISFVRTVAEYALRSENLDAETRQGFEDILAECVEAGRLLEDMLTLARADAGRLEVVMEPLDLSALVESVCEKARPAAVKKFQNLTLRNGNGQPIEVWGDRSNLGRLLWTLLDNAVKYTPEEGQIEVVLERQGKEARVSIRDSGIGISKESLPHVFDRFFRTNSARDYADGTGLGLAIAKWIADAHHATLSAESSLGAGTVFRLVFPSIELHVR